VDDAACRSFGMNLGVAFQLVDDALDYGGKSAKLGKNAVLLPCSLIIWNKILNSNAQGPCKLREQHNIAFGLAAFQIRKEVLRNADRSRQLRLSFVTLLPPEAKGRRRGQQRNDFFGGQ
jgi:hypothetical protein